MDISGWIPWLLILFFAPENAQDDYQVIKVEIAADEEDCEAIGADYLETQRSADNGADQSYKLLCTPMSELDSFRSSYNTAVQRWIEKQANAQRPE